MKKTKEQLYRVTLTEEQLRLISHCVEDCHRFAAGQMGMEWTTCMVVDYHGLQDRLKELQPLMTPHLDSGSSYRYNGGDCPNIYQRKFIAQTYGIYREILHYFHKDDAEWNVYKSPTLTCDESLPLIKIEKID